MRFRTKILQSGKTATGIEVPAKVVAALGSSKRPPVRATIKGYTYRSTVAVMGGTFMLGVSDEVRKAAGVAGGRGEGSRLRTGRSDAAVRCKRGRSSQFAYLDNAGNASGDDHGHGGVHEPGAGAR